MARGVDCTVSEACRGDNPLLFFVPGYDQPELPAEGRKETRLMSRLLQEVYVVCHRFESVKSRFYSVVTLLVTELWSRTEG